MTPPWTDASTDFETGFDQNDAEKLECCVESTVRCYYPEDYVNCYPWPEEYAVTDRTLRSIKCVDGDDRESSVKYDGSDKCVVTGDRGGFARGVRVRITGLCASTVHPTRLVPPWPVPVLIAAIRTEMGSLFSH